MPLLRYGSSGPDVAEVQRLLTAAGFVLPDDGRFDHRVLAAVREYQSEHGLIADGVVGPLTLAALRSVPRATGVDGASVAGIPDCEALAAMGYAFGFPRVAFGHAADKAAPEYLRRLRAAKMLTSGYGYLRSWEDGASQARFQIKVARDLGCSFLWVDCEPARAMRDGAWPYPTDAPYRTRPVLLAWLAEAMEQAFPVGVYGGSWYLGQLGLPAWCGSLPLWLAAYEVKAPKVPAPWTKYDVWQRDDNVRLAGAMVDINETPLTVEQLHALLGGTDSPQAVAGVAPAVERAGGERFVDRDGVWV